MKQAFYTFIFGILIYSQISNAQQVDYSLFNNFSAYEFNDEIERYENEVILDVRSKREYKRSRIPNAILVDSPDKLIQIIENLDHEQPILVYCNDGTVSITPCLMLVEYGFTNVLNLYGGFVSWLEVGYEIDKKRIWRLKSKKTDFNFY